MSHLAAPSWQTRLWAWLLGRFATYFSSEEALLAAIAEHRRALPATFCASPPPSPALYSISREFAAPCATWRLRPAGAPARPGRLTVVYLHGGGFVFEATTLEWQLPVALLRALACDVLCVGYPLAPESPAPLALECVVSVLRAEARTGAAVALVGTSAGGGLALAAAHALADAGGAAGAGGVLSGVYLLSPWLDAGLAAGAPAALQASEAVLTLAGLRAAGRLYAGAAGDTAAPGVSPLHWRGDRSRLPPLTLHVSDSELLLPDARALRDAWARDARAPPVRYAEARGAPHAWPVLVGLPWPLRPPEAAATLRELERAIREDAGVGDAAPGGGGGGGGGRGGGCCERGKRRQ